MVIHAITPSNVHSPIKVLYLLKNGLWMIVLNLSINFIIESLSVYGAKIEIFSGIRFTFGQFVGFVLFFTVMRKGGDRKGLLAEKVYICENYYNNV